MGLEFQKKNKKNCLVKITEKKAQHLDYLIFNKDCRFILEKNMVLQ